MLLFKYFKDHTGEYLAIRDEYVYYVCIPSSDETAHIVTLFDFAEAKIKEHYQENREEIHQMKLYLPKDPQLIERIQAVKNYQKIYAISHEEFLDTYTG
ncbi:MAG: hypothetical protein ABWY25_00290 [Paenisporosarcina sp.]